MRGEIIVETRKETEKNISSFADDKVDATFTYHSCEFDNRCNQIDDRYIRGVIR